MFNKILIANRGEIACRVIKTAKRLGVRTVAVYSDADRKALHVSLADEAVHIGAAPSSESYLIGQRIIDAAVKTGAQAIHPGYGFLSENADFARACADNNLVFIGPPTSAIEAMGSKSAAKTIMQNAGVQLVPGYHGDDQDPALIKQSADEMGYPVLLKAVAGGGGKGMRQVWSADEFQQALEDAKREAMASFANDDVLVEKYLTQPRHVEVQVFCDQHGNGVYLFERDCSVQRRHQKIIEEAPAPNMTDELRAEMGSTAVRAAQAIDYQGAGTVEFLLDVDGSFFFMEMNTRLQVEHPVTEMITGQDLVEWQLNVANGEPLPLQQDQLHIHGHAFEARIYAEDPTNDFLPTAGKLNSLKTPVESEFVRVDTGVIEGDEVSSYYDPMIAKLVVWDENRQRALTRMAKALREYQISGVTTNLNFLYDLATSQPFVDAELDTGFIEKHHELLFNEHVLDLPTALSQASLYLLLTTQREIEADPWGSKNGWRLNQTDSHHYDISIAGETHQVIIEKASTENGYRIACNSSEKIIATAELNDTQLVATLDGHQTKVKIERNGEQFVIFSERGSTQFNLVHPDLGDSAQDAQHSFAAPMNGTVVDILVTEGEHVSEGQLVLIMEAMKMQHSIKAPSDGVITELFCSKGELVDGGAQLLSFESTAQEEGKKEQVEKK